MMTVMAVSVMTVMAASMVDTARSSRSLLPKQC